MDEPGSTSNDRAKTLDRGIRVLKLLAVADESLSVAAIAAELGLHRQVVYRLLGSLEEHGLAQKASTGRYRLGFGAVTLAGAWMPRLEESLRPVLRDLAEACSATAFLMAEEAEDAVALLVVEPVNTQFHLSFRAGSRHPLTRGAGGVAILAGHPQSPDDPPEVRAARTAGIAISKEQVTSGTLGVAAPVRLHSGLGSIASIGVIAVLGGADVDRLAREVRAAARRVHGG
ncbi:IclR family transcriptional regulator [Pseudonocardia sp. WMMC193]|uniref:IclR family transcriptional regulator n=1 Tax=Pseudonocardia sp. WMMC193 TaxID=2911965 RepID=UPI001F02F6D0|nr:helix-turn-helix domain-containing protein [Pseudonocardia sp. WMMC193]MCF7547472.1 helix-turn-helix domain-containing protein [Pseudonocardia sp. WMMC193]